MSNIKRLYPESKTSLIKWIEDNFHEINEFMFVAELKDGTSMNIYDFFTYRGAIGTVEMSKQTLYHAVENNEFIPKKRD